MVMSLQNSLSSFLTLLSKTYTIPLEELEKKWDDANEKYQKVWDASYRLHCKERKLIFREIKRDTVNGCQAILKSGKNKNEKCGRRAVKEYEDLLCKMHGKKLNQPFLIYKNDYGNFEHKKTQFVFSEEREVIGKQGYIGNESGKILELSEEDYKLCRKYKFKVKSYDIEFESDNDCESVVSGEISFED